MKDPTKKPKMKKSLLYHLGNLLIILSLFGFLFIFFPYLMLFIYPPKLHSLEEKGFYITIPKIRAQAPLIDNVDPWNEKTYLAALKKGVAHGKNTAEPGEKGLGYYFAHSSGAPWDLTRYNTVFLRLGELQKGDQIFISKDGHRFVYTVSKKTEVDPTQVSFLLNKEHRTEIVLQTCTPIGTSFRRLLVFADPV